LISWIRKQKWQSSALISAFSLLLVGGFDLFVSGQSSLWVSFVLAVAVLFSVVLPWLATGLVALGAIAVISLDAKPGASLLIALISLLLVSTFATKWQRNVALLTTLALGLALTINTIFVSPHLLRDFGLFLLSDSARIALFVISLLMTSSLTALAWLVGRLLATRSTYVGTSFDRAVAQRTQARLSLEVAEQNQRFEIARDISELVIQRISATISIAEGGVYAVQSDASSASRILQQTTDSARSAHSELRRLFDMLNKLKQVTAAPPKLDDLEVLVIAYRELGFNMNLRHEGPRFQVSEGAELAIYRIAFDALENIRKHAPAGSDVTVDFSWTEDGMQLLVKDNGIENANRGLSLQELAYSAEEDRKALTETIRGAGITAMSERAALYQGSVEATRVPGVGFTISAIFPKLKELSVE
jgi:signal transduction histidine kinase